MGTFDITKPANISNLIGGRSDIFNTIPGWFNTSTGGSADSDLINAIIGPGPALGVVAASDSGTATVNIEFGFDQSTAVFKLDGNAAISYNSLPAGFTIVSANLTLHTQHSEDGTIDYSYGLLPSFSETNIFVGFNNYLITQLGNISATDFIANKITVHGVMSTTLGGPPQMVGLFYLSGFVLSGTYAIQNFSWTLQTPTDPVQHNSHITVTSSPLNINPIDFSQILTASLNYIDSLGNLKSINIPSINWITFTLYLFVFSIPDLGADNPPIVEIFITGTQFAGSVSLGKLMTIFFANATGIYTLTPGKTDDTLYDNSNGGTINVKIPNPFIKTGFV